MTRGDRDQELSDLPRAYGFQVFGNRVEVPAVYIRGWVNGFPSRFVELN